MKRYLAILAASGCLTGCFAPPIGTETCRRPETDEPIDIAGGDVKNGVYMSADWHGELLNFPGGAHYRFRHQLGEEPRWWQVQLSFERDGLTSGSLAAAAGNQAQLQAIDDETITILNGSCVRYWMLLTAGASAQQ